MGSCVSHCSRQDVVHQQTGRVISSVQKSIEVTSDSTLLQKSLAGIGSGSKLQESNEVRDQINSEIRALREQLVRSQVLFTYLLKSSGSENAKSPDGKKELCTLLEGGTLGDSMFQCKSFDGQVLARLYNRSNRSSSSYASHKSTPLHCGYTSLSCPTLPIDFPVVTKSTQTEPLSGASLRIDHSNTRRGLSSESTHSLNKASSFFSPPSTPCETIPETFLLTDVCEVHREPEEHLYPRHRTNSFLSAVKEGNPKLVDVDDRDMKQNQKDLCDIKKGNEISHFIPDLQTSSSPVPSISKICEIEGKSIDENKECAYPRKLSILLEEDYEEGPGNLFSVCSSHPYLNRKKKMSPSCNVNTQTDLIMPTNRACQKQKFSPKKSKMPITETCFPRYGYTIVSQAIQKKTIHSVELPQKLVLRYPPPYTKKNSRRRYYTCSGNSYFQEHRLKNKPNVCSWPTVGEYFPSKSESSHNLTPNSQDCKLQTRHLSLEKQESFSSCDHSLYPDSLKSSVTDCSGWITKSDIELNLRPEPPTYQQSILSSQRSQSSRNRWAWKYVTLVICL